MVAPWPPVTVDTVRRMLPAWSYVYVIADVIPRVVVVSVIASALSSYAIVCVEAPAGDCIVPAVGRPIGSQAE